MKSFLEAQIDGNFILASDGFSDDQYLNMSTEDASRSERKAVEDKLRLDIKAVEDKLRKDKEGLSRTAIENKVRADRTAVENQLRKDRTGKSSAKVKTLTAAADAKIKKINTDGANAVKNLETTIKNLTTAADAKIKQLRADADAKVKTIADFYTQKTKENKILAEAEIQRTGARGDAATAIKAKYDLKTNTYNSFLDKAGRTVKKTAKKIGHYTAELTLFPIRKGFQGLVAANAFGWATQMKKGMDNKSPSYSKIRDTWYKFGGNRRKFDDTVKFGAKNKILSNKFDGEDLNFTGAEIAAAVAAATPLIIAVKPLLKELGIDVPDTKAADEQTENVNDALAAITDAQDAGIDTETTSKDLTAVESALPVKYQSFWNWLKSSLT